MNYNIQTLLRSLNNQQQSPQGPQGIDPNLALVMQAMGMMPRQMDTQGRPIIPGQENPSLMDQHYARQRNPGAMADRYGAPQFSQGPARVQGPQQQVTARQPIEGLPGQVGPAMGLRQTPINMSPTGEERASMQGYRDAMKKALMPPTQQSVVPPRVAQTPMTAVPPAWQGPIQGPPEWQGPPNVGPWQGPIQTEWQGPPSSAAPKIAGFPDLSSQVRPWAPAMIAGFPDRSLEVRAMSPTSQTYNPPTTVGDNWMEQMRNLGKKKGVVNYANRR